MPEPPVVSGLTVHDLHFFVNQLLGTNPRTLFTFQFGSRIIPVLSGQDLRKSPASPSSINQPITPLRSLSCLSHWLSGFTWELGFFFSCCQWRLCFGGRFFGVSLLPHNKRYTNHGGSLVAEKHCCHGGRFVGTGGKILTLHACHNL